MSKISRRTARGEGDMIIAGDIGGTKSLLRMEDDSGSAILERRYENGDFEEFPAVLAAFLGECRASRGAASTLDCACFGVAGPVVDGHAELTNRPWRIDAVELARVFGIGRVRVVNDFVAAAHGVEALEPAQFVTLQEGTPLRDGPRVIIGAGTGLGIAHLVVRDAGKLVISSEAGHAGFAPRDELQMALWQALHAASGRVEVEDVVSGRGISFIDRFLRQRDAVRSGRETSDSVEARDPASIAAAAESGTDPLAMEAIDVFLGAFGAVAGDHALAMTARGGVYVAGGIAPKLLWRIRSGGFLRAFNDRGPFAALTRSFPVHVVQEERLGLLGCLGLARSD